MADALVRLNVESNEFNNKIKKAADYMARIEQEVRRTGATFAVAEKEEIAFVGSIGSMQTQATSAKGKINELTKAFTDLSVMYKNLTEEEKKSPIGLAMQGSLEQLRGRIGELNGQLMEAGNELKTSGGLVDSFADALGNLGPAGQMAGKLLKGAFGPVGIAIAAVVGIIHQVVEAFKRNESAMASAQRAAAPFKAIWQQIQRIFDKLVPLIADGMEKISQGMQSLFGKITNWMGKLSNTSIGKKLGLDTVYEQLKKVQQAQDDLTASNKRIADSERELQQLRRSTSTANTNRKGDISELRAKASDKETYSADERVGFLEKAMELEKKTLQANIALRQKEYELIKLKNSLTQSGTEDLNAETEALNAITEARIEYNDQIRTMQRQLTSARKEAGNSGDGGAVEPVELEPVFEGPSMTSLEKLQQSIRIKLADQNMEVDQASLMNLLQVVIQNGIDGLDPQFENLQMQLAEGLDIPESAWEELTAQINEHLANLGLDPIVLDVKTGGVETVQAQAAATADGWKAAAQAVSTIGGALQQIEDPGAKVAGIISQAVANIALSFAQAAASTAVTGTGWGWLAFAASGIATMISTITAIKSATAGSFAGGGVVPGSSFSGDNTIIAANAGEVVLNRAQQTNLASQLEAGSLPNNLHLSTEISGTNLRVVMDNDNRSKGGSRGAYSRIK